MVKGRCTMKKATKQRERHIMIYEEKTHRRYRAQNLNYFKRYILNIKRPIFLIFTWIYIVKDLNLISVNECSD